MATDKQQPGVEIPENMRNMAETSITQARSAFDEFMRAAESTMSSFEGSTKAMQTGAMDMNRKMIAFAGSNVAATFEFAQRLARAKDMHEMTTLQQEYMRTQLDRMGQQSREMGERANAVGQKVTRG